MDKILIINFGSQYTHLIANSIRKLNIYCEILPWTQFKTNSLYNVKGIILSGSPKSVLDDTYPTIQIPSNLSILGICYGAQLIAIKQGGKIVSKKEYGKTEINILEKDIIFNNIPNKFISIMSHSDSIKDIPNTKILAKTINGTNAVFKILNKFIYGFQFHPEVTHTEYGLQLLKNWCFKICKCQKNWNCENLIKTQIKKIKQMVKNDKVIMALSGGVDSSVCAALINKAIGSNLICIHINNGLMRKNEYIEINKNYKIMKLNYFTIDASNEFLNQLKNIIDPEIKRKIIGKVFIDVFTKEASKYNTKWLGQGTIYPDVVESLSLKEGGVNIKSHHNVGGLPENLKLTLLEPLRLLYKDEVREIGKLLKIPETIINRHPFPGPGLSIRIIGNITSNKIRILQDADYIFISKLKEYNLYDKVWQAAVILLSTIKSVGVMGDSRTYEYPVVLRAVTSVNGMTADWSIFTKEFLSDVSNTIINNVKGCNRVTLDISSKPPATIEWE